MSLTVSAPKTANIKRMEDGTYLAVCCGMVDLGAVYNKRYDKYQDKVMLLWEIPGETVEIDGKEEPRLLSARYTATLGTQGNLRRDLVSWRGKEFTEDELDGFKLQNVIGSSCFLNVQNKETDEGKVYTNVVGVMALPKGTPKGKLTVDPIVFDFDTGTVADVDKLPEWIAKQVKGSPTYEMLVQRESGNAVGEEPQFSEFEEDDGDLPF